MRKKLVKFLVAAFVLTTLILNSSGTPGEGDLPGPMGQATPTTSQSIQNV